MEDFGYTLLIKSLMDKINQFILYKVAKFLS